MNKYLISISLFSFGILLGAHGYFYIIHSDINYDDDTSHLVAKILPYYETVITEENYHCEDDNKQVGTVLSSIIGGNQAYKVNSLSMDCYEEVCSIVLSSCKPWQDSECGERMLIFNTHANGNIIPSSFECLDIP